MTEHVSGRKRLFLLRKTFWVTSLKVFLLVFVAGMVLLQLPELSYDMGTKSPVVIENPEELSAGDFRGMTFATIKGMGNFERAFIYQRYGLEYTYFTVEPYGMKMVVRSYDKVDETWRSRGQFIGKLRPFDDQPFSYAIREIYRETFKEEVPPDAYFLALYEVPEVSGWQLGAAIFAALMWLFMFYMFFFFGKRHKPADPAGRDSVESAEKGGIHAESGGAP